MSIEIISFKANDGIKLDGILNKCKRTTNKVLIQVHGMTSNCFKSRDKTIAQKAEEIGIDTMSFNNRGSEIVRYIKSDNTILLAGMAYEKVEDCYYDILGAIEFAVNLGYEEIYLQGHSLGSTKVVYTYNKLYKEKNPVLNKIKGIILLSLVDIPGIVNFGTNNEFIKLAEEKQKRGEIMDLMPLKSFIHPISVKNFLYYIKETQYIDFSRYDEKDYEFEELNRIQCPLFMRWGNINEMIKQDAKDLVQFMNKKIKIQYKDIGYIDGADHSYHGKNEELAEQIKVFLNKREN